MLPQNTLNFYNLKNLMSPSKQKCLTFPEGQEDCVAGTVACPRVDGAGHHAVITTCCTTANKLTPSHQSNRKMLFDVKRLNFNTKIAVIV